jgi:hypothetical protein
MKEPNIYLRNFENLFRKYGNKLPDNIYCSDKKTKGSWSDLVWYIKDLSNGRYIRYLFIKNDLTSNKRHLSDKNAMVPKDYTSLCFSDNYAKLLKLYAIYIDNQSLASKSKGPRISVAVKIFMEAEKYRTLNDIPIKFWNNTYLSNIFWDYCKKNKLISGNNRPIHTDRSRSAEESIQRDKILHSLLPDSKIYALGYIFNQVFINVDDNGKLQEDKDIDVSDAIAITSALLGLAAPDRIGAELPLLPNQKLKTIKLKNGDNLHYLDWSGSKGFQDNQKHILISLAPQVEKALNFFHYHFKPERLYVRYLKNPNQSWERLLAGFIVNPLRKKYLDFSQKPNLFSLAYALGFYPIDYEIQVLKDLNVIQKSSTTDRWQFKRSWSRKLRRYTQSKDYLTEKPICQVSMEDLIICIRGTSQKKKFYCHQLLNTNNISEVFFKRLNLPLVASIRKAEEAIMRIQKELIPSFPMSFGKTDKGIDLEDALFCFSKNKHMIKSARGTAGSPLFISPVSQVNAILKNAYQPNRAHGNNIFEKYKFGEQTLQINSLRHFANTEAEKGGIPLAVIAAWSGRTSINQTLEYVRTSEEEKSERLISTLDFNEHEHEIRVITNDELKNIGGLPASTTSTGICVQELSVTPCDYINDFLTPCFGCDESGYVCGDTKAIEILEYDLKFQKIRLDNIQTSKKSFLSKAKKNWWIKHSQGVILLEQLISIMREQKNGDLIRMSSNKSEIFITDIKTKAIKQINIALPRPEELLKKIKSEETHTSKIPESMKSLIALFNLKN